MATGDGKRQEQRIDDDLIEQAIVLLPEIGKSLYVAFARHSSALGFSIGQIKAMGYLFHLGPCSVRDVAEGLGVSMPSASETLDRLVELGMAKRTTDPLDRRRAVVVLTPEAQRLMSEVREVRRRQVRAALERLAPAERPVFLRSLQALVDALREEPSGHERCPAAAVTSPNNRDETVDGVVAATAAAKVG